VGTRGNECEELSLEVQTVVLRGARNSRGINKRKDEGRNLLEEFTSASCRQRGYGDSSAS